MDRNPYRNPKIRTQRPLHHQLPSRHAPVQSNRRHQPMLLFLFHHHGFNATGPEQSRRHALLGSCHHQQLA